MKKLLLVPLMALVASLCLAQNESLPQKLQHFFAPLDKSQVPSGYLYDQSWSFAAPSDFRGSLTDSNFVSTDVFGMLYGALRGSCVSNSPNLPAPSVYLSKIKQGAAGDTIQFAVMAQCFDRIRPDALSQNLVSISNGQMFDVPGRQASPYWQDTLFAASLLAAESASRTVVFTMPSDLWFSNLSGDMPSLSFDPGDGNGWLNIVPNQLISVEYPDTGEREIKFRLVYPGFTRYAHCQLTVKEGSNGAGDRDGGTLQVTSGQSQLFIKRGATLILDPGAIIDLESAGSNILIEGDLIVNGDIVFTGLGYFDFNAGNKLVFGPGYNTFNLEGAGKDQRFVRLSSYLDIGDAHRLNWSNGLIEMVKGTYLHDGAGLDFTHMTLHGIGAATAIDAYHAGAITLDHCKVEYLDAAIIGDGLYGCTISNSDFSHYNDRQLNWQNALGVTVRNSNFDGAGATHALWCENVVLVNLSGSYFSGHGTPLPGNYTESDLLSAQAAVPAIAPVSSIRIPTCGVPHDPHDDEFKQPGSDCTLATGMTPNSPSVDDQFHLGSYMMRYDNFDAAIEALRPVAALWQPEMSTYTSNCQQYIKVSKAFIDANDASNLPRSGAAPKQAQASGSLLITPNPANSVAIMHLTDEEHQLNVWNAQGRLVLKTSATGNS